MKEINPDEELILNKKQEIQSKLYGTLQKIQKNEEYIKFLESHNNSLNEEKHIYSDFCINNELKLMKEVIQDKDKTIEMLEEKLKSNSLYSSNSHQNQSINKLKSMMQLNEQLQKKLNNETDIELENEIRKLKNLVCELKFDLNKYTEEQIQESKYNEDINKSMQSYKTKLNDLEILNKEFEEELEYLQEKENKINQIKTIEKKDE